MGGCFVPGCKSGHGNDKGSHLFCAKKAVGSTWSEVMKKIRSDKPFDPNNKNHKICSKHFEDGFIRKDDYFKIDGKDVHLPRKNWTLEENAVPTIFDDLPLSIRPILPKKRRALHKSISEKQNQPRIMRVHTEIHEETSTEIDDKKLGNFSEMWTKIQHDFPEWYTFDDGSFWSIYSIIMENGRPIVHKSVTVR